MERKNYCIESCSQKAPCGYRYRGGRGLMGTWALAQGIGWLQLFGSVRPLKTDALFFAFNKAEIVFLDLKSQGPLN